MSEPDWARFGLATPTPLSATNNAVDTTGTESTGGTDASTSSEATEATRLRNPEVDDALYGGREEELFSEERDHKPWWLARQFFVRERLLFGRWDGVFTSCLVNLLGVIVFLRAGWIVAQAGVAMASLIVLMSVLVVLTSVLSAVGICERSFSTRGEEGAPSGGIYFLVAHVLGGRIGAAVGLVYCFGQTASITLCVAGFGESIAELLEVPEGSSVWVQRGVSAGALLLLALINMAGVKWVVKVQFVLLFLIMLAVLDFVVGSFLPAKEGDGVLGWSLSTFRSNSAPAYTAGESSFTVAGVFFPSVTGIMAGINMSGDLRSPSSDIPAGTLSALGFSSCVYLLVMYVLAATVDRSALLTDYMITEKVSAVGVLLLVGLYTSTLSSSVASLYGTPRVLQSIAAENVIPFMRSMAKGRGPNQVPVNSLLLVVVAAGACLLIGNINALAPIVTTPFLLTYATVDYAYFTLAVTADMRAVKDHRYSSRLQSGEGDNSVFGWGAAAEGMLDRLFPERVTHHKKIITSTASSDSSSLATTPDEVTPLPDQQSEGTGHLSRHLHAYITRLEK
ncbi:Amino acid permease/ SLC12A domain [Trinorchestia longiramus]|nr:Amino acid permease/ SLC12A domain [Trinorchestia longiramus]